MAATPAFLASPEEARPNGIEKLCPRTNPEAPLPDCYLTHPPLRGSRTTVDPTLLMAGVNGWGPWEQKAAANIAAKEPLRRLCVNGSVLGVHLLDVFLGAHRSEC